MTIKELAKDVHKNAKAHGWWDGEERSFGELIALCHSELSEALEEYRNSKGPAEAYYECVSGKDIQDKCTGDCCPACSGAKPCGIPSELADVVIRIFDMAEHYGIDIEAAILEKHEFNKSRPYRHGGKKI